MKNLLKILVLFSLAALLMPACQDDDEPDPQLACEEQLDTLRINRFQVLASHNSYRLRTHDPLLQFMYDVQDQLPESVNPESWDYTHLSLEEQFNDYGIRSIELDVFNDPDGGLFYNRMGNGLISEPVESSEPALLLPGLKVLHYPDFDYNTHYLTFQQALTAAKNWSDAHPNHFPIIVMVDAKGANPNAILGDPFTETVPFDADALATIDQEIQVVFGASLPKVITPDEVRGSYTTLNEAVLADNWPRLADARGKLLFVMHASDSAKVAYVESHYALQGRTMFTFAKAGNPEAAFLKWDNPLESQAEISEAVTQGYIVRTRTDSKTVEARTGDTARRDAALSSGAHIIATDYYRPDGRPGWSDYFVELPDGKLARVNPLFNVSVDLTCEVEE